MKPLVSVLLGLLALASANGEVQLAQLLFGKLRPEGAGGRKYSKDELRQAVASWCTELKAKLPVVADMTAASRELVVVEVQGGPEEALQVKDALLELEDVYEVMGKDGTSFRRSGDKPLEEVRRSLAAATRDAKDSKLLSTFKKLARAQGVDVGAKVLKKLRKKLSRKREEEL